MLEQTVQIDRSVAYAADRAQHALDRGDEVDGVDEIDRLGDKAAVGRSDASNRRSSSIEQIAGGDGKAYGATDTHGTAAIERRASGPVLIHVFHADEGRRGRASRVARDRAPVQTEGSRELHSRSPLWRTNARPRVQIRGARIADAGAPLPRAAASRQAADRAAALSADRASACPPATRQLFLPASRSRARKTHADGLCHLWSAFPSTAKVAQRKPLSRQLPRAQPFPI